MRQATRNDGNRRPALDWLRDHARMKLFVLAAAVMAFAGGFLAVVDYVTRPDRFPVLEVRLEGQFVRVSQEQLLATVVEQLRGNLFLLDLDGVRARVEALPWVRHASVRRQWPHAVHIHFTEQELVARWGERLWLNQHAEVVDLAGESGPDDMPLLTGPAGTHAQALAQLRRLNEIVLPAGLRIAALTLSDQRAWQARLSNGLTVLLGKQEPEARLARLMQVYAETVANRVEQIRQVDLRYTNGFSVEWVRATSAPGRSEG